MTDATEPASFAFALEALQSRLNAVQHTEYIIIKNCDDYEKALAGSREDLKRTRQEIAQLNAGIMRLKAQ